MKKFLFEAGAQLKFETNLKETFDLSKGTFINELL